MGYNNGGNNYRGNNNNRGGGQRTAPRPRNVLSKEHELNPFATAANENAAQFSSFRTTTERCNDTCYIEGCPEQISVTAAYAMAASNLQFGVPPTHPNLPSFIKIPTVQQSSHYSPVWTSPILWEKDSNYRYIPGFSRYVINIDGIVLNAHNGIKIDKNKWGVLEIVADSKTNRTGRYPINDVYNLAYTVLPESFRFYGYGQYSHVLTANPNTGTVEWVALPALAAKDHETGQVHKFACYAEFAKSIDFSLLAEFGNPNIDKVHPVLAGIPGNITPLDVGKFKVREVDERTTVTIPVFEEAKLYSEAPKQGASGSGDDVSFDSDDDIQF